MLSGLLDLRLPVSKGSRERQFRIIQIDVDNAGLRTIDLLAKSKAAETAPAPDPLSRSAEFALPPLRSAGLSITRRGHAKSLMGALAKGLENVAGLADGNLLILCAEDLFRGYRVDIRDAQSGQWRSLHKRDGTYDFVKIGEKREIADEG